MRGAGGQRDGRMVGQPRREKEEQQLWSPCIEHRQTGAEKRYSQEHEVKTGQVGDCDSARVQQEMPLQDEDRPIEHLVACPGLQVDRVLEVTGKPFGSWYRYPSSSCNRTAQTRNPRTAAQLMTFRVRRTLPTRITTNVTALASRLWCQSEAERACLAVHRISRDWMLRSYHDSPAGAVPGSRRPLDAWRIPLASNGRSSVTISHTSTNNAQPTQRWKTHGASEASEHRRGRPVAPRTTRGRWSPTAPKRGRPRLSTTRPERCSRLTSTGTCSAPTRVSSRTWGRFSRAYGGPITAEGPVQALPFEPRAALADVLADRSFYAERHDAVRRGTRWPLRNPGSGANTQGAAMLAE